MPVKAKVYCNWCGEEARKKPIKVKGEPYCSKTCKNRYLLNSKIQEFNGILAANMVTDFMSPRQVEAFLEFLEAQGY